MEIEKAIEILSDFHNNIRTASFYDFDEAVRMGRNALLHLKNSGGILLDDGSLTYAEKDERRLYEPDPRD